MSEKDLDLDSPDTVDVPEEEEVVPDLTVELQNSLSDEQKRLVIENIEAVDGVENVESNSLEGQIDKMTEVVDSMFDENPGTKIRESISEGGS